MSNRFTWLRSKARCRSSNASSSLLATRSLWRKPWSNLCKKIFGGKPAREAATPAAPVETANEGRDLARQALDHFQRSQERLRQGNWSGYGEELKKLETLLRQMQPGR